MWPITRRIKHRSLFALYYMTCHIVKEACMVSETCLCNRIMIERHKDTASMDNTCMSALCVSMLKQNSLSAAMAGMTNLCLAGIKTHFCQLLHCLLLTGTKAPCSLPVLGPCLLVTPLRILLGSLQGPVTPVGTGWVVALTAGDCLVPATCSHHNIASKL